MGSYLIGMQEKKMKKKILIIDDEPDVLTYLSTLLEDNGYMTITARNGVEGMEKLLEFKPDAVTLDVTMPEKSGVKFYRECKESAELKNIPIIIVTGVSEDFEKFISTRKQVPPPDGYVSKPVNKEEMIKLLKKLVG